MVLPLPAPTPYYYRIPAGLLDRIAVGSRVVVPVRTRELIGIVTSLEAPGRQDLRSVLASLDPQPLVPPPLLELAAWMARYYATPIGLTLRAMVPGALWGASRVVARATGRGRGARGLGGEVLDALGALGGRAAAARLARRLRRPVWDALQRLERQGAVELDTEPPHPGPAVRRRRVLRLVRAIPTLMEREAVFGRAGRQREAYEALDALGGVALWEHLRRQLGFSSGVLRGLVARGVATIEMHEELRDPFAGVAGVVPVEPTPSQREAIETLRGLAGGETALLFGVTGSGKTLVYLEALRREVEAGRGAIILVPEIGLTPQTIARVRGAFGDRVAVLHSGLSDGERADAWRALVRGERRVAVGARSAVFAPVSRLAAIIVDEEHDASYKHGERPRYHARTVAMRRARLEGARAILGSATPALESWAARERIRLVRLPQRIGAQPLPPVQVVDLRHEPLVRAAGPLPWSERLDAAVAEAVGEGDQVLLLLNRRGYAHFLQCGACGHVWRCAACSISLTVHRTPPGLRCHYCGADGPLPGRCSECGVAADAQRPRGVGTQQLERWLAERFPEARLARMDADTTTARWSHRRIFEAVGRREVDILFGTQMVAKGLDFPGVTLVGVVDADTGLHLPDFRAAERTFQLIAQVAGRAGRGPKGGRVLVQTRCPGHYALEAAAAHDVVAFAERELEVRRDPPYPPHVALVNVVVSGHRASDVGQAAVALADWLRGLIRARTGGGVDLVGPAPAPLARLQGRWRWHFVLRSPDSRLLGRVLRYAAARTPAFGPRRVRVTFDRDPVSLL